MNTAVKHRDQGSMLVFTALVGMALTAAVVLGIAPVLSGLIDRQQARSAADAAALAGVSGGRAASASVAAANGAALDAWSQMGWEVTVVVSVGDQSATARATDEP